MGNSSTLTQPFRIDDFSADVVIIRGIIMPKAITFHSDTAGNRLNLEDSNGNTVVDIKVLANTTICFYFPKGYCCNGLVCDISDGLYNTCVALIYW